MLCKKMHIFQNVIKENFLPIFCTSITAYFASARITSNDNVLFTFAFSDKHSVLACSNYFVYVYKGMKQKSERTELQSFPSQTESCFRLQQNVYTQFIFFSKELRN